YIRGAVPPNRKTAARTANVENDVSIAPPDVLVLNARRQTNCNGQHDYFPDTFVRQRIGNVFHELSIDRGRPGSPRRCDMNATCDQRPGTQEESLMQLPDNAREVAGRSVPWQIRDELELTYGGPHRYSRFQ